MDLQNEFILRTIFNHKYDEDYYKEVLALTTVPFDMFISHSNIFNYDYFTRHCQLDEKTVQYFIDEESDIIDIDTLLTYQRFSEQQVEKYIESENPNWDILTEYQNVPCKIMQQNKDKLDWHIITENQYMDLEFLISNINNIIWDQLPLNMKMNRYINEGMITLFQQTNIWNNIGYCDIIPIETMMKYKNKFTKLSWESILENMELDEETKKLCQKELNEYL